MSLPTLIWPVIWDDVTADRFRYAADFNEAAQMVRMLPPLNIEKADLDRAVEILDEVFAAVPAEVRA